MSMKPKYLCSTLNFALLDSHGNPGGVGIVFLYKPGTDNLNFRLCVFEFYTDISQFMEFLTLNIETTG